MSNTDHKALRLELMSSIESYRAARSRAALLAARRHGLTEQQQNDVSYYAVRIADLIERLGIESVR